jgi:hypothetical protein
VKDTLVIQKRLLKQLKMVHIDLLLCAQKLVPTTLTKPTAMHVANLINEAIDILDEDEDVNQ